MGSGVLRLVGNAPDISECFKNHGHSLPTTDTESCQSEFQAVTHHLARKRQDNAGSGTTNGVANGYATSKEVRFLQVELEFSQTADGLRRERFIQLDDAKIIEGKSRFLKDISYGGNRTETHEGRIHPCRRISLDFCQLLQPKLLCPLFRHEQERRRGVVNAGGVSRGHRPILLEPRGQLRHLLHVGVHRPLVCIENNGVSLPLGYQDRQRFHL